MWQKHVQKNLCRRKKKEVDLQVCSFVVCQGGDGVVGLEVESFGFHPWEKRF